ncbi:aldo/keto reductase [Streptomyces sp. NPDC019937]|uniref:aldo/keto reductase n=1 Tax=Streptomyces sp. NPDC019937 TaxID=3154787 RepID=UPI00340C4405
MPDAYVEAGSLKAAYLRTALDASLSRLGVEQVDLYQPHGPDDEHPVEEIVDFLAGIVAAGKARHAGVSDFGGGRSPSWRGCWRSGATHR